MATYTPYSSAVPFLQDAPEPGIPELDQHRHHRREDLLPAALTKESGEVP